MKTMSDKKLAAVNGGVSERMITYKPMPKPRPDIRTECLWCGWGRLGK